jgi:aspartyl-tRNA(Asn)/glutamyl-tRNA(Gln) amidotransferase subunit C
MKFSKKEVSYLSQLARVGLQDKELEKLAAQLEVIVGYIDKMLSANIENVEPTSHAIDVKNVWRDDAARETLPKTKALRNAPSKTEDFFTVPRIIEEG